MPCASSKRDLLRLVVEQVGRALERVEVVLEEALFLELPVLADSSSAATLSSYATRRLCGRSDALHVAGDELQLAFS